MKNHHNSLSSMAKTSHLFRYRHLAGEIEKKILNGTYPPGEKLPSIRKLHRQSNLSVSTVFQAYMELETAGLIEARPKSGYYVAPVTLQEMKTPTAQKVASAARKVNLSSMINSVVSAINNPDMLPMGSTVIAAELLPFKRFAGILKGMSHREMKAMLSYSLSEGYPELRRQIASRLLGVVPGIGSDDVIITNGCMEAVALALMAVTRPGDTIAIEAPTNFSFLQLLKEMGILVMEVAADPRRGIDLGDLEKLLQRKQVKACLLMPSFHNPLGALMPDDNKKELMGLVDRYGIPVIEDDISAELSFDGQRPIPLKALDRNGLVLTCSSFSKTLAPGLRIGWMIPGDRFKERITCIKAGTTIATSTLDQHLVSRFLSGGGYDRHLRSLRATLKKQAVKTALAVQKYFPPETRLAVPRGGSLLWIQLPGDVDGVEVYQRALDRHISIIPGAVCANSDQFRNYIQISFGLPFTHAVEEGIRTLGEVIRDVRCDPRNDKQGL